jgi:pimeloyl-ACP methyl ester carboxylesterase
MIYAFSNCVLDTDSHLLRRDGQEVPVEPQVFDLLVLLAENAGKLVSKDTLVDAVWQGRAVSDATISSRINAARAAVGDSGADQRIIRTIPRRGFEMVAEMGGGGDRSRLRKPHDRQTIRFTTSRDGTKLAYAISGDPDGPPVIRAGHFLTHLEMDWQSMIWRPYLDALGAGHRVIRFDQRGTGLSQRTLTGLSLDDYIADLLVVADAAGLDRFSLIASSQGVPVSIGFAARYPERVERLVLYGGFAQGRMLREEEGSGDEAEAMLTMIRAGWGKPQSAFVRAFTTLFCPDATPAEIAHLVDIQFAATSPENAAAIRMAFDQFDVTGILDKVQAPTLVIHARNESLQPLSQSRLIAAGVPGAEFTVLESANHIPLVSDPAFEGLIEATLDFIERG